LYTYHEKRRHYYPVGLVVTNVGKELNHRYCLGLISVGNLCLAECVKRWKWRYYQITTHCQRATFE